jgi:hypothetical protein
MAAAFICRRGQSHELTRRKALAAITTAHERLYLFERRKHQPQEPAMKKISPKTNRPAIKLTNADLTKVRGGSETMSLNFEEILPRNRR